MNDENQHFEPLFYSSINSSSSFYDLNKQEQQIAYQQYWNNYYFTQQQHHPQFAQTYMYYYEQDHHSMNQQKQKSYQQPQLYSTTATDLSIISSPRTPNFIANQNELQSSKQTIQEEIQNAQKPSIQSKISRVKDKRSSIQSLKQRQQIKIQSSTSSRRGGGRAKKRGGSTRRVGRPRKDDR